MAADDFTHEMFTQERLRILKAIHGALSEKHKKTISAFVSNKPEWFYGDWSNFPGIKWKLQNLSSLQKNNPKKFKEQLLLLELD